MAETYFTFKARVDRKLHEHDDRFELVDERLNRHEQDIADLKKSSEALKMSGEALQRIETRHAEMRAPKRRPRSRKG
jgi:hypothetical protein